MFEATLRPAARLVAIAAALGFLLGSEASNAGSIRHYAELLTSSQSEHLPSNMRTRVDSPFHHDLRDILLKGDVTPSSELGDGYLAKRGSYVRYTHTFDIDPSLVDRIVGASMLVGVRDDETGGLISQIIDWSEAVVIMVEGDFFASGWATAAVYGGAIHTYLFEDDGEYKVTVYSRRGDFNLIASLFRVEYESTDEGGGGGSGSGGGEGVSSVPEPGSLALFCAGFAVVGARRRRRSLSR